MKQTTQKSLALRIVFFAASLCLFLAFLVLFCSFKTSRLTDDFLKSLGITKTNADERISSSLLGGGLNAYGLKGAKDIVLGNRKAVTLDALTYAKAYANSAAFVKKYNDMKTSCKPKEEVAATPEQVQAQTLAAAKEAVQQLENALKTASTDLKPVFESSLKTARQNLKAAKDPASPTAKSYAQNYPAIVKMYKDSYNSAVAEWEKKYPANQLLFVKTRLQQFMDETKDIDFTAELVARNGKKYFVKPAYERKGMYWKMAFRAGKEVVEPARDFVQQWIAEIK